MKKSLLCFAFFALLFTANAQNEVMLHFASKLGSQEFSLNTTVNHPSGMYQMKYTRFEYYISEIKITHDGGQTTPCQDLYLLVRPALDSLYSLGQMPTVQNIESITFSVGVPSSVNHLDPASYPANHPLAPQNPEMQWGWTAGYRFAAIEGSAGTNLAQDFQVHALGDANYKTQTLSTTAEQITPDMKMIHITADYAQALKSINVSGGLVVHGSTGAAVTLLNNFKNTVFTAQTSAVTVPTFSGTFNISPNPAKNTAPQIQFTLLDGQNYSMTVTDLLGKNIIYQTLSTGSPQTILLENISLSGLYIVHLWQDGHLIITEKLVVIN